MKTAQNVETSMFEIESIPGPCAFCYKVFFELKRIPGMCGDGICESCDEIRAGLMGHRFVTWDEQKVMNARRAAARRAAAPPVVGTARIPHGVSRDFQRGLPARGRPVLAAQRRAG